MNMKKIVAAAVASVMAVSAMAASSFAAKVVTSNSGVDAADGAADGVIVVKGDGSPADESVAITDIYGARVTLDITAEEVNGENWIGGGIGANSASTGWLQVEWGQAAGEKEIVLGEDGIIEWKTNDPIFAEDDEWGQIWIQAWGEDIVIKSIEILDKDGNAIASLSDAAQAPVDPDPADTDPDPADTTPSAGGDTPKDPVNTGIEGVAVVAGLAILATGAVVVAKKRK